MRIGRWEVRGLEFGRFRLDGGAMFGVVPREVWEQEAPPDGRNRIPLALRGLLLMDGERVVVVDTGLGDKDDARFGERFAVEGIHLAAALAVHHVTPEQVTDLVLTHLHFDHAGGASRLDPAGPAPVLPAARVWLQRRQWEWAWEPSVRDRASFLQSNLEPLKSMDLHLLEGPAEILPGLRVEVCDGHTPGMQVLWVDGQEGPGLVYAADLLPTAAHLPAAWVMGYDLHPLAVVQEKQALLARIQDGSHWLVFEHDPRHAAVRVDARGRRPFLLESLAALE